MVLEVRSLSIRQGSDVSLQDLSFQARAGECVVIRSQILLLGTTLLQGLLGLRGKVSGEVWFEGENLAGALPPERLLALRERVGYVHRVGGLISLLNVQENVVLPLCYHANVARREVARSLARVSSELGITGLLPRPVDELDMVETRLVNLARALVTRPRLLLVDAILEGMDEEHRGRVVEVLSAHQREQGFAVVMTARAQEFPEATRVYDIVHGRLYPAAE
jgi:ABC-type lipoprotein export system ATPase subunit